MYKLIDQYVSCSPPKKMRIAEHVNTSNSRMILVTCISSTMRSWKLYQGIQVQIDSVLPMMFCISLVHLQLDLKLFAQKACVPVHVSVIHFLLGHPLLQQYGSIVAELLSICQNLIIMLGNEHARRLRSQCTNSAS